MEERKFPFARDEVRTIAVSVPSEIMFDLDKFQEVQRRLLGELGCPACTSGHDIRFDIQRQFVFDLDLNIRPTWGL